MPLLFSYGTLQRDDVQIATLGRLLHGRADTLVGATLARVPIDDPVVTARLGASHHANVVFQGEHTSRVAGMVFEVSDDELVRVDGYEAPFTYARVRARLASGQETWVYVHQRVPSQSAPMIANRSIPSSTVIPVLTYPDVAAAVAWLSGAFGFTERLRIGDHRAQLLVGDGAVVAASGTSQPGGVSMLVRVADVDAHCARARAYGARIAQEPATGPYGERQYTALDLHGHAWTFSQSVADIDPAAWGAELRVVP